ncbi:MAG: ABC-type arginine transport system permease subunit [Myxococcota bacterium]|jgi:ABC-type arginine transport system permease subunit
MIKRTKLRHALHAAFLAVCATLITPTLSFACAVCMTGREDDTRIAFELMTGFMTLIPFVLVGGVFYWLRGRLRALEDMHEKARSDAEEAQSLS